MKTLTVFVLACAVTSALGFVSWNSLVHSTVFSPEVDESRSRSGHASVLLKEFADLLDDPQVVNSAYKNYLRIHEKNYEEDDDQTRSKVDLSERAQIFKAKLLAVAKHNLEEKEGKHTWTKGINQFSDMTQEELARYTSHSVNMTAAMSAFGAPATHIKFGPTKSADGKDWREDGGVTPVKNQGQCGSCVSFSTVAALESAYKLKNSGSEPSFSEQELVDCARKSCNGGDWPFAYNYMKKSGITTSKEYPYTSGKNGRAGSCNSRRKSRAAYVDSWGYVSPRNDEDAICSALDQAPIVAGVAVSNAWYDYNGGIYNDGCGGGINHAILLVGYNSEAFIIKNSWDTTWGDSGFMYLPRGENKCQINEDAVWMKPRA